MITCVDDYLIFCKKKEVLIELIKLLENEFKLSDEGDLDSFLGAKFNRINDDALELSQPHLTQRIIETLGSSE